MSPHPVNADDVESEPSGGDLLRYFRPGLVILVSSSYAWRDHKARYDQAAGRGRRISSNGPQTFNEIGQGLQGTIFERMAYDFVLKKEKAQNSEMSCNLRREFGVHQLVHRAFQEYGDRPEINCHLTVPNAHTFLLATFAAFDLCPHVPEGQRTDMVLMDRVLPLPKIIRRALIGEFYPFENNITKEAKDSIVDGTLGITANKHCLVRPYLGMSSKRHTADFSLRNFILGLDDLRKLKYDADELGATLGKAYAIMHWAAHVNGDDVEFVFGSKLVDVDGKDGLTNSPHIQHREISLHLIDFGQCDKIDMGASPEQVFQAFKGAMVTGDNACFIPNIYRSPQLFEIFAKSYAEASKHILQDTSESRFDIDQFVEDFREYAEDFH